MDGPLGPPYTPAAVRQALLLLLPATSSQAGQALCPGPCKSHCPCCKSGSDGCELPGLTEAAEQPALRHP